MIAQDTILKVQAYVDSELTQAEARDMAALVARDPEAGALCAELKEIHALVAANELEVKLPESREFFWSKIEREIVRNSTVVAPRARSRWWVRVLAPAAGFAMLAMLAFLALKPGATPGPLSVLHEIEAPLEEASTISFYSPSAGMTVVWVQTREY